MPQLLGRSICACACAQGPAKVSVAKRSAAELCVSLLRYGWGYTLPVLKKAEKTEDQDAVHAASLANHKKETEKRLAQCDQFLEMYQSQLVECERPGDIPEELRSKAKSAANAMIRHIEEWKADVTAKWEAHRASTMAIAETVTMSKRKKEDCDKEYHAFVEAWESIQQVCKKKKEVCTKAAEVFAQSEKEHTRA